MSKSTKVWLLIIVLGGAGYWYKQRNSSAVAATRYITANVTKGTLISTVSGSGNVVVDSSAKVSPSISGTVANLAVKLGDKVTKGQTLFTVINDQLDVNVRKANTTYQQAKQTLSNAQDQLTVDEAALANMAAQDTSIDQATVQLNQANNQLTNDQNAPAPDSTKIANDQINVNIAQKNFAKAQTNLTNSIAQAQKKVAADKLAIQVDQVGVDSALADLNTAQTTADSRTVIAPIDGVISTLSVSNGDSLGSSSGSSAANNSSSSTPIVIQDLTTLKASIAVNEVDASVISVGQKVSMTFDAIDGLTLTGKVEKIDTVGTVTSGVVTYGATVDFDALDKRVLPEMSVTASITTQVKQDVLNVSSSAVKSNTDGTHYVQVLKSDGTPRQIIVEVGIASDTNTEITSGLTENQKVVTQTIAASTTSTSSTTNKTSGAGFLGGGGGTMRAVGGVEMRGN